MSLHIEKVSLTISYLEKPILSNINYSVNPGDFIVILGSNGSGKSSLLKLLDRRYTATSGQISLNKIPIQHFSQKKWGDEIATLTQNCHDSLFISLTVFENYLLIKKQQHPASREFIANYLETFNSNLPNKLDQIVEQLSGGEKQALALALRVLHPPKVLLLDEHTSALDPKSAENIMALTADVVKKHGITCLLTTHDLSIAMQYGNRILSLRQGEIFQTINHEEKANLSKQELLAACY